MAVYKSIRDNLIRSYNQNAEARAARRKTVPDGSRLDAVLDTLAPIENASLLDIGAGNGIESEYLNERGIAVSCVDFAIENARMCRTRDLPSCVADACELSFRDATFDAAYSTQCFFHIPRAMLPRALSSVRRVLKPGGLFFLHLGGGPDREEIFEGDAHYSPARFFSFHSDDSLRESVGAFFDIVSFESHPVKSKEMVQQELVMQKTRMS